MNVVDVPVGELIPYAKNPRKNDSAVDAVAKSIERFGFKVPIVIDAQNEVICGHTRLRAAVKLGLNVVPCVVANDLTEEEIRAFRLADNRVSELAEWDDDLLLEELDGILDIDMADFGFEFHDPEEYEETEEDDEEDYKAKTLHLVRNIQNLDKAHYDGVGMYDIPALDPVYELPEIKEWIGFNYVLSDKNPEGKAVHFFMDDYQFERIWRQPEKYIEKLKRYVCIATPDFSPYGDMPHALQLYNHYRKHWVGKVLQVNGVTVIPTVRASSDPRSMEWFLDGEPVGGIIMMSSMWASKRNVCEADAEEWRRVKEHLKPKKVFMYGGKTEGMKGIINEDDPVEYIPCFTQNRFSRG